MIKTDTDIAIIGAGASGLAAAISAAKIFGGKITLIERLQRVGKKILSTGNGRCNLSNENISDENYSGDIRLLGAVKESIDNSAEFFESIGLACKTDGEGRIYPHSMAASSVLDALRFSCECAGVQTLCNIKVERIEKKKNKFIIYSDENLISSKRVILAAGGCAAPSLGTDGSGYSLAENLGHTVTRLLPALAPLRTDVGAVKSLKGLRTAADVSLVIDGNITDTERGEVQFSDGSLSGICVFNISAKAAQYAGKCELSLDIAPEYTKQQLYSFISNVKASRSGYSCEELLTGLFHKRIGQALLKQIGVALNSSCGDISNKAISALCSLIKDWRFMVTGVSDWSLAQVTCGGICGNEIKNTLESAVCRGLYLCGEIIDIQGKCGGFNLDWAWKSGFTAGRNAALSVIDEGE